MIDQQRQVVEVVHAAEVADVLVCARDVVREFKKGGYVGALCEDLGDALHKLDAARDAYWRARQLPNRAEAPSPDAK